MPPRGTLTGLLERCTCVNLRNLKKAKCKVLHMGRGNPKHKYRLGGEWVQSSPEEKDLELLADENHRITEW